MEKIEKVFYVVNPRITIDRFIFPLFANFQEAGLPRSDLSRSLPQTKYCSWFAAIIVVIKAHLPLLEILNLQLINIDQDIITELENALHYS